MSYVSNSHQIPPGWLRLRQGYGATGGLSYSRLNYTVARMNRSFSRWSLGAGALALMLGLASVSTRGQIKTKVGEWPTYGADLASTRYSPLDQINADNFNKLQLAFRFKTDNLGPRPEFQFQGTPLMVNGVLYVTAGTRRAVVALDATTGELLWMHS